MKSLEESFYKWVGKKIAIIRRKEKLTQEKLANKIGLSRASIVNIEKGRQTPPLFTFWALAEALKVEPYEILPLKNEHLLPDASNMIKKVEERKDLDDRDKAILSDLYKKN